MSNLNLKMKTLLRQLRESTLLRDLSEADQSRVRELKIRDRIIVRYGSYSGEEYVQAKSVKETK